MTGDRGDALRDSAALLYATAERDREGVRVVLDHGDNREVCEILAVLLAAACRGYSVDGLISAVCRELRSISQEGTAP